MKIWQPTSWQTKNCLQSVSYPDPDALNAVIQQITHLPPLVTPLEVDALKRQIAQAQQGKQFLLQGGDCAESFDECTSDNITNKIRILLQMSLILIHGLHKPVIRVGRIAGQYAKPRSSDIETIDGVSLPSYRGDIINGTEFTPASRIPNPQRMVEGYHYAAITLNYVRALVHGGFASLLHAEYWELDFAKYAKSAGAYHQIVKSLRESLQFISCIDRLPEALRHIDFYTSHEALHLPYEQALTRQLENGRWYNLSTHLPWAGMRTVELDSAHIEYMRGIGNPIAIKIGSKMTPEWLLALIQILNPENEPGRITLIHRFGAEHIAAKLPSLIIAVQNINSPVLWSSDPMHGNTTTTAEGYKTRKFDDILSELKQAFAIHRELGSHLGGVHFELTGDNVTECTGGARGLTETDLKYAYKTLVDPRLNYEQALEMALLISKNQ